VGGGFYMPQLSLYIDADILNKVEAAAKIDNKSISKWVSERLREAFEDKWPENYKSLFGCSLNVVSEEEVTKIPVEILSFLFSFKMNL
jgi:hypothetical protein